MEGWIKVYRKLAEKSFYRKDSEAVHLWIHLLFCANRSEREEYFGGKRIICKPGQFTTGRKQLAESCGINESKIERLLNKFEKIEQQIEQQKSNVNRLISILNWSEYQTTNQDSEQQANNERTTSEQQVNTLQEVKNIRSKEVKNKECEIISIFTFEEFWNLYDKKVGDKEKLSKKWDSIKESERSKIRDHILLYKISQPEKKFRKDPQTYLNNHSWNDEIINSSNKINHPEEKLSKIHQPIQRN